MIENYTIKPTNHQPSNFKLTGEATKPEKIWKSEETFSTDNFLLFLKFRYVIVNKRN